MKNVKVCDLGPKTGHGGERGGGIAENILDLQLPSF